MLGSWARRRRSAPGSVRIPLLSDILVSVVKNRALARESGESCIDEFVLRIGASGNAQQYVRVDQTRSDSHLVVILEVVCVVATRM